MYVVRHNSSRIFVSRMGSVDCMDAGLVGAKGAGDIIGTIRAHPYVSQLILSHNCLGDDGCLLLFKFLGSERRYRIKKISLNSNEIGDRGLATVARYLECNSSLKELFLQNNNFACTDPSLASSFASAINSSSLEVLTMTTNVRLSDSFAANFLPNLHSPTLKELHLSALGMTPRAVPDITGYISSHRCGLHTIHLNGNSLGFRGVRAIIQAIKRHNYSLTTVEMWSNAGPASTLDSSDNTPDEEDDLPVAGTWQENNEALKPLLFRNDHLGRMVRMEALALLKVSRALMLPCRPQVPSPSVFPFTKLPMELQLYILSFLSPTLSTAQRTRIYIYASSPSTLPTLFALPNSKSSRDASRSPFCLRDPGTLDFGIGHTPCSNGKCAGPADHVLCHKQESKTDWLDFVGCMYYEPREAL